MLRSASLQGSGRANRRHIVSLRTQPHDLNILSSNSNLLGGDLNCLLGGNLNCLLGGILDCLPGRVLYSLLGSSLSWIESRSKAMKLHDVVVVHHLVVWMINRSVFASIACADVLVDILHGRLGLELELGGHEGIHDQTGKEVLERRPVHLVRAPRLEPCGGHVSSESDVHGPSDVGSVGGSDLSDHAADPRDEEHRHDGCV
mmetsp:Transcript_24551/g.55414  ORF Transcript_24551/g.55414 Transcript_24551/m.55414 type:complete len:202 (+) Transcript_24551:46-651(+)